MEKIPTSEQETLHIHAENSYKLSQKFYDYIIIGSGAGGAVTAYYLTKAGAKVLMIEAGKHFQAHEYPRNEMSANAQLLWGGGTDLTKDAKTVILRGKVLGGGTVVNQALLDRFDDIAWRDFKAVSDVSFFDEDNMAPHYDAIEKELSLYSFTRDDWNKNAELYVNAYEKLGYEWKPLRRGQNSCTKGNDCIVCLGGCSRNSKQSMVVSFIKNADHQLLDIVTECHVNEILNGREMMTVTATQQGQPIRFYAKKCIVSAGTIGSTHILLKSQLPHHFLPALGKNFHCHPQFMNIALMDEIIDSHKGSFQSVKSAEPRFREWGFKFENVFAGPGAIAMLKYDFGKNHQQFMHQYRHMACMEVALRDETAGNLYLDKKHNLVIDKPLSDIDKQKMVKGLGIVHEMFEAVGAKEVMSSQLQIGLHLMGGCAMGHKSQQAVVNEGFKVYGTDNLYVVDGSVFPNAPGINPSLSIMALAHRASQSILAEAGVR